MVGEEKKIKNLFNLTSLDLAYLTDDQRAIVQVESKKSKPNKRIFKILKRFSSVSKSVEGFTSYFKGFDMDTNAMSWIVSSYQNMSPRSENYTILVNVIESYTRAQIWLGYFFSLVNSLNHNLNLRQLTAAEKTIRKMELEVERGRRIFSDYNNAVKNLRKKMLGFTEEEEVDLSYFK